MNKFGKALVGIAATTALAIGGIASPVLSPMAQAAGDSNKAVSWAVATANDNSHGYDMRTRTGGVDFDCSSFVMSAEKKAGFNVSLVATASMKSTLEKVGFSNVASKVTKSSGNGLRVGDVLLRTGSPFGHTALVTSVSGSTIKVTEATTNGSTCSKNSAGLVYCGKSGDQNGKEIRTGSYANVMHDYQYVMRPPDSKAPATTTTPSVSYYPKYTGSSASIVDALKALGVDSSYAHRQKIAAANSISGYSGTAAQNTTMLSKLKAGTLKKA